MSRHTCRNSPRHRQPFASVDLFIKKLCPLSGYSFKSYGVARSELCDGRAVALDRSKQPPAASASHNSLAELREPSGVIIEAVVREQSGLELMLSRCYVDSELMLS